MSVKSVKALSLLLALVLLVSSIGCSTASAAEAEMDGVIRFEADSGIRPFSLGGTLVSYKFGPASWTGQYRRNDSSTINTFNLTGTSSDFSSGVVTLGRPTSSSAFYLANLTLPSGAYIDYTISADYESGVYDLSGKFTTYISVSVSGTKNIYPTSVDIYAGSTLLVSGVSFSAGVATLDIGSLVLDNPVDTIRFRAYYPSGTYSPTLGNATAFVISMHFIDSLNFHRQPDPDLSIPILESILTALRGLASSASNAWTTIISTITSSPEEDAAASQYVKDMEEAREEIDKANEVIEEYTNRPSADALVPARPDIIQGGVIGGGDAAATAMMDGFGDILASPLILQLLLLTFTLAFLSYVLFGKKG